MSDRLTKAFEELTIKAQDIAKKETWVRTGIMPDQFNAMLAVLWLEIKTLRENIAATICRHVEGIACSVCDKNNLT